MMKSELNECERDELNEQGEFACSDCINKEMMKK